MRLHLVAACLLLAACTAAGQGAKAYNLPFEGRWDCGVAVFTFTDTSYNNGTDWLDYESIEPEGRGHVVRFRDGYFFAVYINADGTLDWVSGESGDQFTCRRAR